MFGEFETRNKDLKAAKPFDDDRRMDIRRHQDPPPWPGRELRANAERRLDADWRFAMIRRLMRLQLA